MPIESRGFTATNFNRPGVGLEKTSLESSFGSGGLVFLGRLKRAFKQCGDRVVGIDGANHIESMGVRVFRCVVAKFLPRCLKEEIPKPWV